VQEGSMRRMVEKVVWAEGAPKGFGAVDRLFGAPEPGHGVSYYLRHPAEEQ